MKRDLRHTYKIRIPVSRLIPEPVPGIIQYTMQPKTTLNDLPSTHNVSVYIHNCFVDQLKLLKKEISVAATG